MLPLTTLMHNNAKNSTMGYALNRLIMGLEPMGIPDHGEGADNPLAKERVEQLIQWRILAQEALNWVANCYSFSENVFKVGQRVWLKAKDLTLPYRSIKLAPRCYGPFKITQVISPMVYKLKLPAQWSIHPTFHASLLTPYVKTKEHGENYLRPPLDLIKDEEQYEVEAIRSHQHHGKKKQLQYLIKWKGYPESNNTWEPEGNLQALHLVKDYHRHHLSSSIKRALIQLQKGHSPSWLPPIAPALPTSSLNPLPLGLTYPCLPRTLTTTPSFPRLLKLLANTTRGISRRRRSNHSPWSTNTPMLHFSTTPTAKSTSKCLKSLTLPTTLHPPSPPWHHPAHRTTPHPIEAAIWPSPLTPTSPNSLPKWKGDVHSQKPPLSMSHTPPHHLFKKSPHHRSTSTLLGKPTPLSHLAQHKPSFISARTNSVRSHEL
jgi:hypothetical protein